MCNSWKEMFDVTDIEPNTPEYYLSKVKNWVDPNPPLVIEEHEGIFVVRDDLLVGGTKERIYDYMVKNEIPAIKEFVFGGGSRFGFSQLGITAVCNKYGKKATFFIAKGGKLHPNSQKAKDMGANIFEVTMGMLNVCLGRARRYVDEDIHRKIVEFAGSPEVLGSVIKVAQTLPFIPDEIFCVAGSGTLNLGLQMAFPNAKVYCVSVGHNLSKEEAGRAEIIKTPLKFAQEAKKDLPPWPANKNYEAKAYPIMMDITKEYRKTGKKKILFWNVGS